MPKHIVRLFLSLVLGLGAASAQAEDVTPGGSTIKHHSDPVTPPPSENPGGHLPAIRNHLEPYFGSGSWIMQDNEPDRMPVDLIVYPPDGLRPFWTFVTSGMSERAMAIPQELIDQGWNARAELVLSLPKNWFTATPEGGIEAGDFADWSKVWPLAELKYLARLPHIYKTWLWDGHTVPNGNPAAPYAENTDFIGVIILGGWSGIAELLPSERDYPIVFLSVIPLTDEEMTLKLEFGTDELRRRLGEANVTEMVDIRRPSVAP